MTASTPQRLVAPMLATLGDLLTGDGWAYEFTWDGVRAISYLDAAGCGCSAATTATSAAAIRNWPNSPDCWPGATSCSTGRSSRSMRPGTSFAQLQHRMHVVRS